MDRASVEHNIESVVHPEVAEWVHEAIDGCFGRTLDNYV